MLQSVQMLAYTFGEPPPPCKRGIIGIREDPSIVTGIPFSHYDSAGGPLDISPIPVIPA